MNEIIAEKKPAPLRMLADATYDDLNIVNLVVESGKLARSISEVKVACYAMISSMLYDGILTESFSSIKDTFLNDEETQPKRAPQLHIIEIDLYTGQKKEETEVRTRAIAR